MNAFLFPGQGAQSADMAQSMLREYPEAKSFYDQAREICGYDLTTLGDAELALTRYSQPAITVHCVCAFEKARSQSGDIASTAMAGFSLGEYTALYAAGVIGFEDLLKLVSKRSELMQDAAETSPGAMFAIIGLEDAAIEQVLKQYNEVYAVNYNCSGQLVIAGAIEPTEKAAEELLAKGARRAHRLAVNGAFHTPFMSSAAEKLKVFASEISFSAPKSPIYSNATGLPVAAATDFPEYLRTHMISPVRFTDEIRRMRADGYENFIELGPGKVLTGLLRKI